MLPEETNYTKALMCFGVCLLLMFLSLTTIFRIVTNPASFVLVFTMAVISGLAGLALWNGPQAYARKLFEKQNIIKTSILFGSMILALWFSLINESYLLSLIFTVLEFNALMLFFCNTFPMGRGTIRQAKEQAVGAAIKHQMRSMF